MVSIYRGKWVPFLLPLISGILGFASFPKLDFSFFAWVDSALLMVFVYKNRSIRTVFLGGILAGFVKLAGLLVWIPSVLTQYGGLPRPAAWGAFSMLLIMLGIFPASACAATRFLMNRVGDRLILTFPLIWISMEYLLTFLPFGGFPWLLAGYSQTSHVMLIQIADVTGVYGVSFLVLWINAVIAWTWLRRHQWQACLPPVAAGIVMLCGCMIYGIEVVRRWDTVPAQYRAAMLQGNLSAEEGWQSLKWKYQEGYSRMADGIKPGNADLIILPEAPSPVSYEQDAEYRSSMQRLASRFKLGLVFNNIAIEGSGSEHRYFNSAYFMNPDGEIGGRYDKIHLVPFGEYIPLKSLLAFARTISKDVGDFSPGRESPLASIGGEPSSAMICFEAVFPDIARRLAGTGSRLIINLTNDAWYGTSAAPYQHLMMTRWRALENRRFLLRATNSGISAIIDPLGRVQVSTGVLREDICVGNFAFIAERSFYTRHGDWFPGLCAIITTVLLLIGFIAHSQKSGEIGRLDNF